MKTAWEQLTYFEFEQIAQIAAAEIPESYKTVHLLSILTGESVDDLESLPISQFIKLTKHLKFLDEEPQQIKHKNEYKVNGRKYILQADVDKINTAQYLDYTTYIREGDTSTIKLASCFLIPEGHQYGDGYSTERVLNDIGCMSFLDVRALAFFLQHQYAAYILILVDSMEREMKKKRIRKSEIRKATAHWRNMARSLLSSK